MGRPITPLTSSLEAIRRQLGVGRPETARELETTWRAEVGDAIADLTERIEVRRGVLHIMVTDPAVVESLRWRAEALRESLGAASPGAHWESIVVRAVRAERDS